MTLFGFTESCGAPATGGGVETGAGVLLTVLAHPELASDTITTTRRNTNAVPRAVREESMAVNFSLELGI